MRSRGKAGLVGGRAALEPAIAVLDKVFRGGFDALGIDTGQDKVRTIILFLFFILFPTGGHSQGQEPEYSNLCSRIPTTLRTI